MNKSLPMKSPITDEKVARYVVEKIVLDSDLEHRLRVETRKLPAGGMISGSDVGALLGILALSVQAKKTIEIGTFTGYTALKVASVLPTNGKVVCCDISTEWTDIGRKYWDEANQTKKIDLRIAPALETLNALLTSEGPNSYDFAFIDADKTGYDSYYEMCMKLVRPGGLIVLDNMLWGGAVADVTNQEESTKAIRSLNEKVSRDPRVQSCLMTVGDGLMLAYKK
ncbi:putative O-methyltransferase [compost metagenome]